MVPELELNDIRCRSKPGDMLKVAGDDDPPTRAFDGVHVTAIPRLFEQNEGPPHRARQSRTDCRMRLADAAAQMRRDMQDLHSAATAGTLWLGPPGMAVAGSICTIFLNCASSMGRCASMLSGKQ